MWLSISNSKTFVATEYRQFATFSNYWRNLTLTSTLFTNLITANTAIIQECEQTLSVIHPPNITLSLAISQVHTSHMHQHVLYAILISYIIFMARRAIPSPMIAFPRVRCMFIYTYIIYSCVTYVSMRCIRS